MASGISSVTVATAAVTPVSRLGSTTARSGATSQEAEVEPGKVRAKSAGSSANGPYEVSPPSPWLAPTPGASRQYASAGSRGRQVPASTTAPARSALRS
ncbi:hypothetical protein B0E53_05091 [Micromonospora sp. MH33]|nr:hypothetical protein B0E53_05091 [Micromonospora sp. MH33]